MIIGIKDGKVWDICSCIENRRTRDDGVDVDLSIIEIVELEMDINVVIGDTWQNGRSLMDSPKREIVPPISLKQRILDLEDRVRQLELL